jgi:ATP-dependent DNA helicase RecQ
MLTKSPEEILLKTFGYHEFRDDQKGIIDTIISGSDALVLMPTGSGKSICYQIPSLIRNGVGIVVSPLIALMDNQVSSLRHLGIRTSFINSTQTWSERNDIENELKKGEIDILYVAPERLLNDEFLQLIDELSGTVGLALFAIDEAHCVSEWGHDFRPEYRRLTILHERFPNVPRIALTATADAPTRKEICERLRLEKSKVFITSFDRKNINYRIQYKDKAKQQLLKFIQTEYLNESGIVYCLSRKKVEQTAEFLSGKGLNALPYHAGLSSEIRASNQNKFLVEERATIMVATIAFGMGIDKPNVRYVAHMDLPKSMEGYYQETGRCGRDGLPATAIMFYGLGDVINLRRFIDTSDSSNDRKRVEIQKLNALLGFCESINCRRQIILNYFGEQHTGNCDNCDNCINPPEKWEGHIAAQKALSCVARTKQLFGVMHLIDVLLGNVTPKTKQHKHDQIKTWAVGVEHDNKKWNSIFRQLVSNGYLEVDISNYGGLKLTPKSRNISDITEVWFRDDLNQNKRTQSNVSKISEFREELESAKEEPIWEVLRGWRSLIAKESGMPAYVIFHDRTLVEIVNKQPKTMDDLSRISGIGQSKLDLYGKQLLGIVNP